MASVDPVTSRRVRAYWRSRWMLAHVPPGVASLLVGVWLGVLRPEDMHAIDRLWYGGQVERYGSEAYVRSGLFAWERRAVELAFGSAERVLVAAAGAGREMVALHRRGHAVAGFECDARLRARAATALAAAGVPAEVAPSRHDECPALAGPFDGAVVGWTAYAFIPTRARRVAFLQRIDELVDAGSPLLVSARLRPAGDLRLRAQCRVASCVRRARAAEPPSLGDTLDPYFVHRFTPEELEDELSAAGFEVVHLDEGAAAVTAVSTGAVRRVSAT